MQLRKCWIILPILALASVNSSCKKPKGNSLLSADSGPTAFDVNLLDPIVLDEFSNHEKSNYLHYAGLQGSIETDIFLDPNQGRSGEIYYSEIVEGKVRCTSKTTVSVSTSYDEMRFDFAGSEIAIGSRPNIVAKASPDCGLLDYQRDPESSVFTPYYKFKVLSTTQIQIDDKKTLTLQSRRLSKYIASPKWDSALSLQLYADAAMARLSFFAILKSTCIGSFEFSIEPPATNQYKVTGATTSTNLDCSFGIPDFFVPKFKIETSADKSELTISRLDGQSFEVAGRKYPQIPLVLNNAWPDSILTKEPKNLSLSCLIIAKNLNLTENLTNELCSGGTQIESCIESVSFAKTPSEADYLSCKTLSEPVANCIKLFDRYNYSSNEKLTIPELTIACKEPRDLVKLEQCVDYYLDCPYESEITEACRQATVQACLKQ